MKSAITAIAFTIFVILALFATRALDAPHADAFELAVETALDDCDTPCAVLVRRDAENRLITETVTVD